MMRDENQRLNASEYEQGATVLQSRPQFLVIELTHGCNLACPMCRAAAISTTQSRMERSHFDQIAEELFATANIVDLRGWGESLILPDITDFITCAAAAGCRIRFVSNLSFHRPAVLDCLVHHNALLTCSLDTADPEVLTRLRKGARMSAILANLRYLAGAYRDPNALSVLCTLQTPALASLPQLPEILDDVGVRHLHFASVSSKNLQIGLDVSSAFARNQVQQTLEACRRYSIAVTLTTSLPGFPVQAMPRCMRPWTTMHVSVDGRIGYCDHLVGPFAESQLLGHIAAGVLNVWNGEAWQQVRSRHNLKTPQFKKCVKCYREKGSDFEPLWLGKEWS